MKNSNKKMSKTGKTMLILTSFIAIWLVLPLAILLGIGLLPTLVSILTSNKNKTRVTSVACFNLASLFPFIFKIIDNFTIDVSLNIISNVFSLIFIYGVSAVGMILYQELPNLFLYFGKGNTINKLKRIDKKIDNLKEEWGEEEVVKRISSNSSI